MMPASLGGMTMKASGNFVAGDRDYRDRVKAALLITNAEFHKFRILLVLCTSKVSILGLNPKSIFGREVV